MTGRAIGKYQLHLSIWWDASCQPMPHILFPVFKCWQREFNYWDVAAGIIILKEAGGFIDFFEEDTDIPLKKNVLATNSLIHEDLKELLLK